MRGLPRAIQPLLTLITGKPLQDEKSWSLTPWHHLAETLLFMLVGVCASVALLRMGWPAVLLLPLGWMATLHGVRKSRTIIMHQCAHANFIRCRRFDYYLGKAISVVLGCEEFTAYRRSHCEDHHGRGHQTQVDPTVRFLFDELGLRVGMASAVMWRRLFLTTLSPAYHLRFLMARLRSHFIGTSLRHRIAFLAFWITAAIAVWAADLVLPFTVVWLIPIVPLYHCSAAFRLASKHVFPARLPAKRDEATLGAYTLGIFLGDACPGHELVGVNRFIAWSKWWLRLGFYHLPCRLAVLVGDGPQHDLHHRMPRHRDWPNYIHNRAKDALIHRPPHLQYHEVWGLRTAIQRCFESLSQANPADYGVHVEPPVLPLSRLMLTADD
jgi:hypothetical protein